MTSALLVLEDGRTFRGEAYGAIGETFGEAVFATGMTGYQETLTDPSYHRQVVVQTAPHIGNTGVNDEDGESARIWVSGYVVRDPARRVSSWRARGSLDDALADQGIVGISGVDTRALTRHLRERGAMRVGISSSTDSPDALLEKVRASPSMVGADLVGDVTTNAPYVVPAIGERRFTVAAIDLGIKTMTPHRMAERGIEVHVLPATTTAEDILARGVDGVFMSNGPGDPSTAHGPIETLRELLRAGTPFFGICFGNQVFGHALGFSTYKLGYGHRGINQPVKDLATGRVEVTAHNHGFAVAWPGTESDGLAGREHEQSAVAWPTTESDGLAGREHEQGAVAWPTTESDGLAGREHEQGAVAWPTTESDSLAGREHGHSAADATTETEFGRVRVSHICLNDNVVEGLELRNSDDEVTGFSVQYHPEAAAGPHDASYLFDRFTELMGRRA